MSGTSDPEVMRYILETLTTRLDQTIGRFETVLGALDGTYVRKEIYDRDRTNATGVALAAEQAVRVTTTDLTRRMDAADKAAEAADKAAKENRTALIRIGIGGAVTVAGSLIVAVASAGGFH